MDNEARFPPMVIAPFLLPGESLLWTGRPRRGLLFQASDLYLIPLGLLMTGFAVSWNLEVWSSVPDWSFRLSGLLPLAMGLYLIFGRLPMDSIARDRLFYAVTNRRVVILRTGFRARVTSYALGSLPILELEEEGRGRGSIVFDMPPDPNPWFPRGDFSWRPASLRSAFHRIENVRIPYDIIWRETERIRDRGAETSRSFIG
jgi:hypothetical protein